MNTKKNIALLYGGLSSEREISLKSGKSVGKALENAGFNVTYIDTKFKNDLKRLIEEKFDFAFICLHGKGGEDGSIQGFLETLGIPYSGPDIAASATAMNKARTKQMYNHNHVPTADYFLIRDNEEYDLDKMLKVTGDNVVVKAAKEGSSIGLYTVQGKDNIQKAINKSFEYDDEVVVERFIAGREFTVAVLELPKEKFEEYKTKLPHKKNAIALPVIEIIPKNDFYDFASKYDEGGSIHVCPAKISESLTKKLQKAALDAYYTLKCYGYCRTDFIADNEENIYALETNTIPGMTSTSLFPDAARAAGIEFEELCKLIVNN